MSNSYQVCSKCVMDTTDSRISFDSNGVCDHCNDYESNVSHNWFPNEIGRSKLSEHVERIKKDGRGRDFDCILGMSGGVDSSYMLHLAVKELGLRPLVFHVDVGWNSERAMANIEKMINQLNLDLYTEVINWEEMKEMQLAFIESGVPHIDIPQDIAYMATLYKFARENGIKYILNGGNISTECVRNPLEWIYYGSDLVHVRDIINRFTSKPLKTFPLHSAFFNKLYLRYIRGIQMIRPLDCLPYNKSNATDVLTKEYNWLPYEQKHFESRYTKFYEGFWLPKRFGFDTRKVQYSSLILTGQMTREEALDKLIKPVYTDDEAREDFKYVSRKLGISEEELRKYYNAPLKYYWDYKNSEKYFIIASKLFKALGIEKSIKR